MDGQCDVNGNLGGSCSCTSPNGGKTRVSHVGTCDLDLFRRVAGVRPGAYSGPASHGVRTQRRPYRCGE